MHAPVCILSYLTCTRQNRCSLINGVHSKEAKMGNWWTILIFAFCTAGVYLIMSLQDFCRTQQWCARFVILEPPPPHKNVIFLFFFLQSRPLRPRSGFPALWDRTVFCHADRHTTRHRGSPLSGGDHQGSVPLDQTHRQRLSRLSWDDQRSHNE